jgi:AcrR family transcriptional regulator
MPQDVDRAADRTNKDGKAAMPSPNPDETGEKPRRRLSPKDRRQQIIDAAVAYFAEVGFDGGTRELAKRLGVTQPLIYRYFPSKDDLIRQVYDEVYVGRWRAEWDDLLSDRSRPLRDRLVAFYERYTEVIFASEWMRIYLFSGLRGLSFNRLWISFVEDHIISRICAEIRHAHGLPSPAEKPLQPAEIDLYWMYHGGIFYYGMRRQVYEVMPHVDLASFIKSSVDSLLAGYPETVRRIVSDAGNGIDGAAAARS